MNCIIYLYVNIDGISVQREEEIRVVPIYTVFSSENDKQETLGAGEGDGCAGPRQETGIYLLLTDTAVKKTGTFSFLFFYNSYFLIPVGPSFVLILCGKIGLDLFHWGHSKCFLRVLPKENMNGKKFRDIPKQMQIFLPFILQ